MGDLQPGNGGGGVPPDDGAHRGLPDLPPEWGTIVIPDDPAELGDEALAVRRELRRQAWRNRLRRLVGLGPAHGDTQSLGVPIVIIAVALITTLLSLFVVTWDHQRSATAPVGPDGALQQTAPPIAGVTLTDASGSRVKLGDVLPAMLLLVDDCDCTELIRDLADVAPKPVTVVPVSTEAACAVGAERNVLCLADPAGTVTGRFPMPSATATSPTSPTSPSSAGTETGLELGPSASAAPSASASASAAPAPVALAVPVDGDGNAYEPIVVSSPDDLIEAFAQLTAGA